ncbi:hypothetical protein K3169_17395 [Pseudomonas phytophila]|uniref:Uncharacterized protein n=1 Tax=Pseudomonas phytophila TaxID=2867264 RepID=A0ABY6F938_9PSED|nr:hypothetical protein [Pseudomonas phytophila]UXZ94146.1 hypothetical protein K3169_17395 [Pseudomonas phytophila]
MSLTNEEEFALQMLFSGQDKVSLAIRLQLKSCAVKARKHTGVGFFTSIALAVTLPVTVQRHWDCNFEHRELSHGGSFMCWIENSSFLELEAVAYNGEWPKKFNSSDFKLA